MLNLLENHLTRLLQVNSWVRTIRNDKIRSPTGGSLVMAHIGEIDLCSSHLSRGWPDHIHPRPNYVLNDHNVPIEISEVNQGADNGHIDQMTT